MHIFDYNLEGFYVNVLWSGGRSAGFDDVLNVKCKTFAHFMHIYLMQGSNENTFPIF